jgi:phage terminase Nu1 subunit (DNA packaging protein)
MVDERENGLPPGVPDAILNRAQLARAIGKSEPTIDRYIADGMPFITEGTNGRAWEFQLSDCWAWCQAQERADLDARRRADEAVDQMRLALVGGRGFGEDDDRQLSPRERQELYDAERAYNLVALQRRDLVRRGEVVEAFERVFVVMRDGLTALPDRLERDAGLTGKALDLAIGLCDAVLAETHRAIEQAADEADGLKQAAE